MPMPPPEFDFICKIVWQRATGDPGAPRAVRGKPLKFRAPLGGEAAALAAAIEQFLEARRAAGETGVALDHHEHVFYVPRRFEPYPPRARTRWPAVLRWPWPAR